MMNSSLSQWSENHNINIESWLGNGDFGEAYSTECGKVLKRTSDPKEFLAAFNLQNQENENLVNIYHAEMTDEGDMFILMEALDTDGVEDVFSQAHSLVDEHAFGEWDYFDEDDLPDDVFCDPEALKMIDDICISVMEMKQKGIDLPDIQDGNIGKKNGKYVLFDFRLNDDRSFDDFKAFILEQQRLNSQKKSATKSYTLSLNQEPNF